MEARMQAQMEDERAALEKRMADLIAFVSRMGANQDFEFARDAHGSTTTASSRCSYSCEYEYLSLSFLHLLV
jgi:hypothetical protein